MEAGNGNDHRDGSLGVGEGEKEERERRHEHARRKDDELGGSGVGHDDEVLCCAVLCGYCVFCIVSDGRKKKKKKKENKEAQGIKRSEAKTED